MARYQVRSRVVLGIIDYYVVDTHMPIKLGNDTIYRHVDKRYFDTKREAREYASWLNK